jgi:2-dehydropantoate 2-reductase
VVNRAVDRGFFGASHPYTQSHGDGQRYTAHGAGQAAENESRSKYKSFRGYGEKEGGGKQGQDPGGSETGSGGARQPAPGPSPSKIIYVLGLGTAGKLVAHSLAGISYRPPITLLLHRTSLLREWVECGRNINIIRHGVDDRRRGFDVEVTLPRGHGDDEVWESLAQRPIHNLIVSTKCTATVGVLMNIAHRLTPDSTICFLQNGMGVLDEINEKIFPDPEKRPHYMQGVVSHGVYDSEARFEAHHVRPGTIGLGPVPRGGHDQIASPHEQITKVPRDHPSTYLLRTLTRTPILSATGMPSRDLLVLQLEKLAVDAVINPLTALFDCYNGELLHNHAATRVMRLLLAEISLVIRSMPQVRVLPNVNVRLSASVLECRVRAAAETTAVKSSPMLVDLRYGRETEIDYINGYIVRKGEELGLRCMMNYLVVQEIRAKEKVKWRELQGVLPLEKVSTELP